MILKMTNNSKNNINGKIGVVMQTIIKVTINGEMFLFNNCISKQEYDSLQALAGAAQFRASLNLEDETNIQLHFIDAAKQQLGIHLEPIKISHVIRI